MQAFQKQSFSSFGISETVDVISDSGAPPAALRPVEIIIAFFPALNN